MSKIGIYYFFILQVPPVLHLDQPVSIQARQPQYRRPHPLQYPPEGLALWASGVHPVVWGSTSKRGPGVLWAIMVSSSNPGAWYPPDNPGPFSIWSHVCRIFLSFSAFKKKETLCKKFAKSCGFKNKFLHVPNPYIPGLGIGNIPCPQLFPRGNCSRSLPIANYLIS